MAIFVSFFYYLSNILHTWPHDSFHVMRCRSPWRYFKVIGMIHIKFLKNGVWCGKSYYWLLIGNHTLAFDWCQFWWPWMIYLKVNSPSQVQYLGNYRIHHTSTETEIANKKSNVCFQVIRMSMTLAIFQLFKVIKLFHIEFLVNCALYGKSYYRGLLGNHTLAFDWCHFWWPLGTFEGHFSLGCHFHIDFSAIFGRLGVAWSPSNSWASC